MTARVLPATASMLPAAARAHAPEGLPDTRAHVIAAIGPVGRMLTRERA